MDNNKKNDEIQAAVDYGIDISQLKANLELSYSQRIAKHSAAFNFMQRLQKARKMNKDNSK